jgi:hypothetical protein
MRSFVVAVALLACACGEVLKVPDAGPPDVLVPDSSGLTCQANEMVCNSSCADLMTSELFCGNCNTQCASTEGCLNGMCVPANTNCQRVKDLDAAAPNALYRNPNTGVVFFCDFTNSQTYDDFRIAQFDVAPPAGYALARGADFANPTFAAAFIGFFNTFGGVRALTTFTIGNCCFSTVLGQRLQFGAGTFVFPGVGTGNQNCTFSISANTVYTMSRNQSSGYMAALPDDFFSVNAPVEAAGCSDGMNPAYFYKRRNALN